MYINVYLNIKKLLERQKEFTLSWNVFLIPASLGSTSRQSQVSSGARNSLSTVHVKKVDLKILVQSIEESLSIGMDPEVSQILLQSSNVHTKVTSLFVIDPSLMMAQSWAESTREITNLRRFINQFPLNIIRSIRQFKRINKKYVDKNVYCIQSNMYQYIYIYIYMSKISRKVDEPDTDKCLVYPLSTYFSHIVGFTKIYHFPIYIYIYNLRLNNFW